MTLPAEQPPRQAHMRRRRHETTKGENGRNISEGSIACVWLWNGGDGGLPC